MTSEVARSSRFEGTAFSGDPIDLLWDFAGVWATSREQIHVVCVSYKWINFEKLGRPTFRLDVQNYT